jgi:5-methylcytosine-specific restriction endonuclease McrA
MTAHFHPALVLNADFRPLSIYPLSVISWQDAIRGVVQEKYAVVEEYDTIVHSQKIEMFVPSVVALREYQEVAHKVAFTRINVFLRDEFRCQYCGGEFSSHSLTFDHVIPRKLGGTTCWENIVAACEPCNSEKGHGHHMKPLRVPVKPSATQLRVASMKHRPTFVHGSWRSYIHWNVQLES